MVRVLILFIIFVTILNTLSAEPFTEEKAIHQHKSYFGVGPTFNRDMWGIQVYGEWWYATYRADYTCPLVNYKEHLDMDFVEAWGDSPVGEMLDYEILAFGVSSRIYKGFRGYLAIGKIHKDTYTQIEEGAVQIFEDGIYTIKTGSDYRTGVVAGIVLHVGEVLYVSCDTQQFKGRYGASIGGGILFDY